MDPESTCLFTRTNISHPLQLRLKRIIQDWAWLYKCLVQNQKKKKKEREKEKCDFLLRETSIKSDPLYQTVCRLRLYHTQTSTKWPQTSIPPWAGSVSIEEVEDEWRMAKRGETDT